MRPKTLLILAVVVAVLVAFIYFFESDLPSSEERAELANKVLGGLEASEVEALEIVWGDPQTDPQAHKVRLVKETVEPAADPEDDGEDEEESPIVLPPEERWRLVEPLTTRADRREIDRLLSTLTNLEKRRTVEDVDRAEVGLEPPVATVTLTTEDGDTVLEVGSEMPVSNDRVVALAGEPDAFFVLGSIYEDLTRDPGEWRDRQVLAADADDVLRIELAAAGRETVVLVRDDAAFRVEAPFYDRADHESVDSLVRRLTDLKVQSFVDDPEATEALELDPPHAVVTAQLGPDAVEAGPFRLELGAVLDPSLGRRYGRVGGQVFELQDRELGEDALRPAEEWRSKRWSEMQVFQIDGVEARDARGTVALDRVDGDWRRGEDRIPYTPVSDLLFAIGEAEALRVIPTDEARAAGWTLDTPSHTVTVRAKDLPDETLTLYPPVEEGVPARAGERDVVLLLPADRLAAVDEALAGVRDADPIPEDPEEPADGAEGEDIEDTEDAGGIDITAEEGGG